MTKKVIRLFPTNSLPEETQLNFLSLAIKNGKKNLLEHILKIIYLY